MTNPSSDVLERMELHIALDFADNSRPHSTMQAPADSIGELREALQVVAAAYRERDATIERLSAELERANSALRCVYLKGVQPSPERPDFVSQAFDRAFDGHRPGDAALTTVENSTTQTERG